MSLLPPTFSSSSSANVKISIPPALGAALKLASTGEKVTFADIPSSSKLTGDSAFFMARRFKAMNLTPVQKK